MKTGLVLEGGGMRGIYTAGVLDAMDEAGLRAAFDGVIGVSAGAVHGCSFVSGQRGRSIRYFTRYCRDRGFMSVYSLLTTGSAVGEKLCYHDIPEKLDQMCIRDSPRWHRRTPRRWKRNCRQRRNHPKNWANQG